MEAKKLIQVSNYIITHVEDVDTNYIVVENIGRGWEIRYSDQSEMYSLLMMNIETALAGNENAKLHLEATLCGIFVVSNIGIHDEQMTDDICRAATDSRDRVKVLLDKVGKEIETEDAAEWMHREDVMETMLDKENA